MFLAKSDFTGLDMKTVIDRDLASKAQNVCGIPTAIAQLEVVGAEALIRGRFEEIVDSLIELKVSRNAERIFLLAMDLNAGTTWFIFPDATDSELLKPIFNLSDKGGFFMADQIVTRKELLAKLLK
jgi:inorganic pyrophosphatase/exopolyphosphatase